MRVVLLVVLCAGVACLLLPVPRLQAPRVLRRFGRHAGMEFAWDPRGRLALGPEAESLVASLIWRFTRAGGCFGVGFSLSHLLLLTGPPLSRSGIQSLCVAAAACAGTAGPYLFLRPFLQPFSPQQPGVSRRALVEDYLGPLRRVVGWLAGVSVICIPVGAGALAGTSAFDGSKIYWEGLVGMPLASAGVLLAVELESRGGRDRLTTDPALLYLWDVLRGRALCVLTAVGVTGVGTSWLMASDGLVGVALDQSSRPAWVNSAHVFTNVAGLIFLVSSLVMMTARFPTRRVRRRLWPDLAAGAKVRWGALDGLSPRS